MSFICDQCGLCCRMLACVPQLAAFDRGDGVCRHLTENNLCEIYDSRPDICNVEKMYPAFASQMSKEEYCVRMTEACLLIKKRFQKNHKNEPDEEKGN